MFGFICGLIILFFLILFILYIISMSSNSIKITESQTERNIETKKPDRYCPACGRSIPFDANICPYCGKRF